MKKILLIVLLSALCTPLFSQQWIPNQAIASLVEGIETAQRSGLLSSRYGVDMILGSYLNSKEKSLLTMYLESGEYYYFIAGGDDEVLDVDIIVSDDNYTTLARDIENDKYAIVEFTPKRTGTYCIELSMANTKTDTKQFAVLTVMKYGLSYIKDDITSAMQNLEAAWEDNSYKKRGAYFASDPEPFNGSYSGGYSSFCLFGRYITAGSSDGFNSNGISSYGDYMLFAAGDKYALGLELQVTTTEGSSKDVSTAPYVAFNSGKALTYDYSIMNQAYKGKSFIICCMLELR